MYFKSVLLAVFFLNCLSIAQNSSSAMLTVIASGEAHGMVNACDCQLDPGGGLPKRAHLLKTLGSRENFLYVDAGGFAAGGLYDSYTEGRKADSIRTVQMIRGMGVLGYDAVAVGDDDLQYGVDWLLQKSKKAKLPLISANCFSTDGKPIFPTHVYIKKGSKKIAITAVTTTEKILQTDKKVIIGDPYSSLKKIWKEIVDNSDYQIILSHLGNTKTAELADSLHDCDLLVNGHRKNETSAISLKGDIPVMQFGFQGKSMSFAVFSTDKKFQLEKSGWHIVDNTLPDDSTMLSAINIPSKKEQTSVYDLYIMSQCPYGIDALKEFVRFLNKTPKIEWNIWFIGNIEDDTVLTSLHGPEEVKDEMVWLAIKNLYPSKWYGFLKMRADSIIPTELILKKMSIPFDEVDKWIAKNGNSQLGGHYLRSKRMDIKASPTLLINNMPYEKTISSSRLLKDECEHTDKKSAQCNSLPQCIDDTDCKQKGKIGKCIDKKCVFKDALPFSFSVIIADSTRQHPEKTVIATTEDLFPGAIIEKITMNSNAGKSLIKSFTPEALPFYLFNKDVKLAHNFDQIESGLIEKNGAMVFKKGITRYNYFYKRKLEKGKTVLFIDPFFKEISQILNFIQSDSLLQKKITILPVIYDDPQSDQWGTEEGFRQEEALRWITMEKFFPEKYNLYLGEYAKLPGRSYWFKMLESIGLSNDLFVTKLRANSDILFSYWKQLVSLSVHEPVAILFDNREIAITGSKKELEVLLIEKR